ncbi:hypothetical protein AC1031_006910 [Aphanomyces cochlioides]|nr:hypothetical protein AC1031_006910 [Aphanomyces cochlioides]
MPGWRRKRHVVVSLPPVSTPPANNPVEDDDHDSEMQSLNTLVYPATSLEPLPALETHYHTLLTYPGLVHDHTTHLRVGDFVARSAARWASRYERPLDSVLARQRVEQSAAIAIQTSARTWQAKRMKSCRVNAVLELQQRRATWFGHLHAPSAAALALALESPLSSRLLLRIFPITDHLPALSSHRALAACLLQGQLVYRSAVRTARYVRQPQPLKHLIASAVIATSTLLHRLRLQIAFHAAVVIQCKHRSRIAIRQRAYLAQVRRRHRAAASIQIAYRSHAAREKLRTLRNHHAALVVQCAFRCYLARQAALRQCRHCVARRHVVDCIRVALPAVAASICNHAARRIQRVQRGRAARSRFRELALQNEALRLKRSPERGYLLYARGAYYEAALLLEQSFLHGVVGDQDFWIKFGTAHFYTFEASGDRSQLDKALIAYRQLFPKADDVERDDKVWLGVALLYAKGLFYAHMFRPCLDLATAFLAWQASRGDKNNLAVAHALAANVLFDMHQFERCREHLEAMLALGALQIYSEVEIRYMLAVVLTLLAKEADVDDVIPHTASTEPPVEGGIASKPSATATTPPPSPKPSNAKAVADPPSSPRSSGENNPTTPTDQAPPPSPEPSGANDPAMPTPQPTPKLSRAEQLQALADAEYAKCFAIVELWPGLGFYHGVMTNAAAEALLEPTPDGTFLLHRIKAASLHVYVKVKWGPNEYTSMKISRDDNSGMYSNPNSMEASDVTLLGFLAKLPKAAGIALRCGLRSGGGDPSQSPSFGVEMTSWDEWKNSNHAWLQAAYQWELHSGYVFASVLASCSPASVEFQHEARLAAKKHTKGWPLSTKKSTLKVPPAIQFQVEALILQAKAARGLGKNMDSLVFIQQAVSLDPAADCIRRSWAPTSFASDLRKVQKLDRLYVHALGLDTYTPRTHGNPQAQVLLLECIYRQHFHKFATIDVHRRLVRAHIRAYCFCGFDLIHLELACRSTDALVAAWQRQDESLSTPIRPPVMRRLDPSVPKSRKAAKRPRRTMLDVKSWSVELLFEQAEVVYRSLQLNRAIELLQILLRRTKTHAAYGHIHRLSALRLAFVYAHAKQFDRAIHTMTQLLHQVEEAPASGALPRWPVVMAFEFSSMEVRFLRGVLFDMQADSGAPTQDKAWHDFAPLHADLVSHVKKMLEDEQYVANTPDFRAEHVRGVVVTIGECHGLEIDNVMCSNVRIVVQCDGKAASTAEPPSWETMQPNWNLQKISVPASSKHAHIHITILNRVQLRDVPLATLQLPISALFATGHIDGKDFHLRTTSSSGYIATTLFMSFQLTTFKPVRSRERQEQRHIAFALSDFVNQAYVWQFFATRFVRMSDHFLARHFLVQALRRHAPPHDVRTIYMMLDVARCDLACRGSNQKPQASAIDWLQKAHNAALMLERRHHSVENDIVDLMQQALQSESSFERKLNQCLAHSLASDYVVVTSEHGSYYVNKDTGDCILEQPLGFEPSIEKPPLRRTVIFSSSMKSRILALRQQMKQDAAADPEQWVAMFDEFHGRMFYVSQVHSMQSYKRPERYVMVADEMTVYSVLVIQDVFRARRKRAWLRRLFRRTVHSIMVVNYMLAQWHIREEARAIRAAKVPLTCLKLTIESASELRAADRISSDPFVEIQLSNRTAPRRTTVRKATLEPVWNEVFHLRYAWLDHEQAILHQTPHNAKDEQKEDDEHDHLLSSVDLMRVTGQLAENLVMNEDHGIANHDNDEGPTIALTVFDYDAPTSAKQEASRDFLGLAIIPIDPLDHGKPISAELQLRDEDGYLSPRSRGTLSITVQWIPYVFPLQLTTVMVATRAIARLDALKRQRYLERAKLQTPPMLPKPTLSDDLKMLLELIDSKWQDALIKLADAIVMADQLQRLVLRLNEARKSHTNAEEEEHIERRLKAVIRDQFHVKRRGVQDSMRDVAKCLRSFAKVTYDEVNKYVLSGGDVVLQEKVLMWFDNLGYSSETPRVSNDRPIIQDETYDRIMDFVLVQKECFVTWETSLRSLVGECFQEGKWSFDMSKELAICRKIEDTLSDAPLQKPPSTPSDDDKIKHRQVVHAKKLDKQRKHHKANSKVAKVTKS